MQEDKRLKTCLILQSFSPLFALLLIRHIGRLHWFPKFFSRLLDGDCAAIGKILRDSAVGDIVIITISIIWILLTIIVAVGFRDLQEGSFDSHGEGLIILEEKRDSGATFLVTFVLPLLIDDVSTAGDLISFVALLWLVVYLLVKSGLFYQNPVLVVLKYKVYEFIFTNPYNDVEPNRTYIGITKGTLPQEKVIIKRRYIADNVFLVYND